MGTLSEMTVHPLWNMIKNFSVRSFFSLHCTMPLYRTMNTGPFQDVQADFPGDCTCRTFKLDVCWCVGLGVCVLLVISIAKSQMKTATFVVLLGP